MIPLYAHELGASIAQVGIIMAIAPYIMALLMVPMGLIADSIGKSRILIGGFFIMIISSFLYSLAGDILQLAVVRFSTHTATSVSGSLMSFFTNVLVRTEPQNRRTLPFSMLPIA